ncbi:MAG: Maf family protein [Coprothermobacterota bacterium]|nr:Maf family protein [Coprothermobacterota bacterium]
MRHLILASASPRRWELLRQAGLQFTVSPAEPGIIDEEILAGEKPAAAVERLALRKAEECARHLKEGLVLGSDTLVSLDGCILGKPHSRDEAMSMLRKLSGRTHQVWTGLALLDLAEDRRWVEHESTLVTFRPLALEEIDDYVSSGEPLDKAGAYAIQGRAAFFIPRIEGCYFNVVGLPLFKLGILLQKAGISVK